MEFDEDFQEEFNKIVSDDNIKEAEATFTPELFDDTYLNMELALPKDRGETTFVRVKKRLKDRKWQNHGYFGISGFRIL